jgi:hypothetical protein
VGTLHRLLRVSIATMLIFLAFKADARTVGGCGFDPATEKFSGSIAEQRKHPPSLSITHISDGAFALSESFVILFVTPIRGGVTDERGEGIQYIRLA